MEYAYINMDYSLKLKNKDINTAIDTQKILIKHKKDYFTSRGDADNSYIKIEYVLKNGTKIYRNYEVSYKIDVQEKCKALADEEKKSENIMKFIMQCENTDKAIFTGGNAAQYDENYNTVLNRNFDGKVARNIYKAIKQDAEAGNIQEYVIPLVYGKTGNESYNLNLGLAFTLPAGEETSTISYEESSTIIERLLSNIGLRFDDVVYETDYSDGLSTFTVNVEIGPKCENTINALIKYKIIDSKESLLTYEQLSE